ncbi:MAG: polyphosphate--glucose phosphotransferase [Mycobacteriales bacterium]
MATGQPEPATPTNKPRNAANRAYGIDIGGSGIKGAVVDVRTGKLLTDRARRDTPQPSDPDAVAEVVAELVAGHGWTGEIGATFPAVVQHGVTLSAANVDKAWIGADADALFTKVTDQDVLVINDADAAGLAEARFGAAKGVDGVVIVLTLGTGIGSALLHNGVLVPNTELGHLELDGKDAERRAASSARERHGLSWSDWAKRVEHYLEHVERLFTPDLFVLGGGVSKRSDKWLHHVDIRTPITTAKLLNDAGIVGAALAANEHFEE